MIWLKLCRWYHSKLVKLLKLMVSLQGVGMGAQVEPHGIQGSNNRQSPWSDVVIVCMCFLHVLHVFDA